MGPLSKFWLHKCTIIYEYLFFRSVELWVSVSEMSVKLWVPFEKLCRAMVKIFEQQHYLVNLALNKLISD